MQVNRISINSILPRTSFKNSDALSYQNHTPLKEEEDVLILNENNISEENNNNNISQDKFPEEQIDSEDALNKISEESFSEYPQVPENKSKNGNLLGILGLLAGAGIAAIALLRNKNTAKELKIAEERIAQAKNKITETEKTNADLTKKLEDKEKELKKKPKVVTEYETRYVTRTKKVPVIKKVPVVKTVFIYKDFSKQEKLKFLKEQERLAKEASDRRNAIWPKHLHDDREKELQYIFYNQSLYSRIKYWIKINSKDFIRWFNAKFRSNNKK